MDLAYSASAWTILLATFVIAFCVVLFGCNSDMYILSTHLYIVVATPLDMYHFVYFMVYLYMYVMIYCSVMCFTFELLYFVLLDLLAIIVLY